MTTKFKGSDDSGAAIVCEHIAKNGLPILHAFRDEPLRPEDSGWQFLCNSVEEESEDAAKVWALNRVVNYEPTLTEFIQSPVGTEIFRVNTNSPWQVLKSKH